MSTLPGNPHHTVVIDLQHPDSPQLECNAPADAPCHAVWDCECEAFHGYAVEDGLPVHRTISHIGAANTKHVGRFDANECNLNDWYENTDEHTEGIVRIPVEIEHDGDYVLFLPQSASLLGGEGAVSGVRTYRKRPVEVEAMRFTVATGLQAAAWCGGRYEEDAKPSDPTDIRRSLLIPTLEGVMRADLGDYIIRGVQGEFYPCKPDIFEQTYEAVTLDA